MGIYAGTSTRRGLRSWPGWLAHAVPAARVLLRTASVLTVAGVPLLLVVLP